MIELDEFSVAVREAIAAQSILTDAGFAEVGCAAIDGRVCVGCPGPDGVMVGVLLPRVAVPNAAFDADYMACCVAYNALPHERRHAFLLSTSIWHDHVRLIAVFVVNGAVPTSQIHT